MSLYLLHAWRDGGHFSFSTCCIAHQRQQPLPKHFFFCPLYPPSPTLSPFVVLLLPLLPPPNNNHRAPAAPPAAGSAAGFNRFKALGAKVNVLARCGLISTKSRKHRESLDSEALQDMFTTYFKFQHLETGDGRARLLDQGTPVLQHMRTGETTFDDAVDALMQRVYGPLVPGQERERWVLYQEEHELLADGGRWEETKTSTERSYEGLQLKLTHHPQFADAAFPDKFPVKVEMTPDNWSELLNGQPLAPGKRRRRCQHTLAYKLMRASTELRDPDNRGVPMEPTKAAARAKKAEAEAAHGLWELAVRREHAMDFDAAGFKAAVAGMKAAHWDTISYCAAAVWSLAGSV